MPPILMAILAIGGQVTLTRSERDRMPATMLAQLAIGRNCKLDANEYDRFSPVVRMIVQQGVRGQ